MIKISIASNCKYPPPPHHHHPHHHPFSSSFLEGRTYHLNTDFIYVKFGSEMPYFKGLLPVHTGTIT
jgi:hypothetical protein